MTVGIAPETGYEPDPLQFDESGDGVSARLTLRGGASDLDKFTQFLVATSIQLLDQVHVRPNDDLVALLDSLMRDGITHKMLMARPYEETADLLEEEHFKRCAESTRPSSSDYFTPISHSSLDASTRQGPGYDRSDSLQRIEERYEAAESWKLSFTTFLEDPRGRNKVQQLRVDGWLDWQILMSFMNVGLNWRVEQAGINPMSVTPQQMRAIATRPETASEQRLPVEFVIERFDDNLLIQTFSVAQSWRLRSRGERAGAGNMRDLLTRRYHFAIDDVAHKDLLEPVSGASAI